MAKRKRSGRVRPDLLTGEQLNIRALHNPARRLRRSLWQLHRKSHLAPASQHANLRCLGVVLRCQLLPQITSFNGERVRSLGDLRQKLAAQNDAKTAKIGVLRRRSEVTLSVEVPERDGKSVV